MYRALKEEARSIKQNFIEGEELANAGEDPRGQKNVWRSSKYHNRANHAWLTLEISKELVPSKSVFLHERAGGLNRSNRPSQKHHGAPNLVAGMSSRGSEGIVGKLRWFHPATQDTIIFFLLFLIGTGWNASTALSIDISSDELWFEKHPIDEKAILLRSWKVRAGRAQFAISYKRAEFHPYQIIRFMIERTKALRARLQRDLKIQRSKLKERNGDDELSQIHLEISRLEAAIKSPWLYHNINKIGDVNYLTDSDGGAWAKVLKEVQIKHKLAAENFVDASDFRDVWIGYAYEKSGYQWLMAMLAAGHASQRTLRTYLHNKRWRQHGNKAIRRLQDAIFSEIKDRRIIDGAALRLLVKEGRITEQQRKRLQDHRWRTRVGTGCLAPHNPPDHIEPEHQTGKTCTVQRCTLCRHAVVFDESLEGLTKRYAELIYIKETSPTTSWINSSWTEELEAMIQTISLFSDDKVEQLTDYWLEEIREGREEVQDLVTI